MASNASARRRYAEQTAAANVVQDAAIFRLPTDSMLLILGFLDVKSLCASSKVCRQWHNFASDRSLWKTVDLREWRMSLKRLWKIVRTRLYESVTELHIRGFLGSSKKADAVSSSLLSQIRTNCPRLRALTLSHCDMSVVDLRCLPAGLSSLCLADSMVPLGWFDSLSARLYFPNLLNLNLANCSRLSDSDLANVSKLTSLKRLNLSGCYRIGDPGIRAVAESLQGLEKLDLASCSFITDLSLHYMGRHLRKLNRLSLSSCRLITDAGIASLVHNMADLLYLDLTSCVSLTDNALASICAHCSQLKCLSLSGCSRVTEDGIMGFLNGHVEVKRN